MPRQEVLDVAKCNEGELDNLLAECQMRTPQHPSFLMSLEE